MLLDNGADVNAIRGYFGTAIQDASAHGHKLIVQLLLQSGAEVNARGGKYGSALNAAIKCGKGQEVKNEIVHLLLEHGAVKLESEWSSTNKSFSSDSEEFSQST